MPEPSAVCIRCGKFKAEALSACGTCGFVPSSAEDQARSLMLSPAFDAGEEVIGLEPAELHEASALVQSGHSYPFESQTLARVALLHSEAKAITPRRLMMDLVRWLAPPLLALAALFWLLSHG